VPPHPHPVPRPPPVSVLRPRRPSGAGSAGPPPSLSFGSSLPRIASRGPRRGRTLVAAAVPLRWVGGRPFVRKVKARHSTCLSLPFCILGRPCPGDRLLLVRCAGSWIITACPKEFSHSMWPAGPTTDTPSVVVLEIRLSLVKCLWTYTSCLSLRRYALSETIIVPLLPLHLSSELSFILLLTPELEMKDYIFGVSPPFSTPMVFLKWAAQE